MSLLGKKAAKLSLLLLTGFLSVFIAESPFTSASLHDKNMLNSVFDPEQAFAQGSKDIEAGCAGSDSCDGGGDTGSSCTDGCSAGWLS